ncbi:uncharacterized protein RAG0_09498 [Rhynchosporium agropyri]|uniref:Uncharacterized protein n=1 Tax=Rhynchosporium agropyri TaxID=914238 RepID=A0A1E1KVR6_9HELO|nr:uncharacterized protein RAG0_09498 [Rhynchosporium agropyri]
MGSGKAVYQPPPAASYRDVPDYAETASMSSAVLLEDVEAAFPDEELPPYQDEPVEAHLLPTASASTSNAAIQLGTYAPPDLPFQTHDHSCREYRTRFPLYSTDSESLYKAIKEQAFYPPNYQVQIYGSHTETRRNGNKETKARVDDFLIVIDITNLLGGLGKGTFEILPNNKRGYRGTRIPSLHPTVSSDADAEEGVDELKRWCDRYVADKSGWKSFTLKRKIINHDKKRLERLLRSAIAETNYRGHVSIDFPEQRTSLIVYSPGKINEWRITSWIRWVFYCAFLWIFAWPFLFIITARYETVKAVYRYADQPPGDDMRRRCIVMTEVEWFHRWQSAIKRAAIARMMCRDGVLDEHYRLGTERTDVRGELHGRQPEAPRTGNAFVDGAIGLLGQGLRLASDYNDARGWGADS